MKLAVILKNQSFENSCIFLSSSTLTNNWIGFVGYGAGGRLGIGGTDSVLVPTLLESIQHVFIKKVAVNSGGKHCLALSADNDVYSWGEGDDGKLGHGNRRYQHFSGIV